MIPTAGEALPFVITAALAISALIATDRYLKHRQKQAAASQSFARPLIMLGLTLLAIIAIIITLPHDPESDLRANLLTLLGIALTAVVGLASTTFISNAMAGLLIRSLGNFKPGDFIRVNEHFGRVTERGLFHTELQTEHRDLTTIPNFYLVNNTVTVVHASGTIVSADVSLGYDNHHATVNASLIRAAERTELADPFVHITNLGDVTVTYRLAGFLEDTKTLISNRSRLRTNILDTLHEDDIEVASPAIMIQRPQDPSTRATPRPASTSETRRPNDQPEPEAERVMFDKADRAELLETMRHDHADLIEQAADLRTRIKELPASADEQQRRPLQTQLEAAERRAAVLAKFIDSQARGKDDAER